MGVSLSPDVKELLEEICAQMRQDIDLLEEEVEEGDALLDNLLDIILGRGEGGKRAYEARGDDSGSGGAPPASQSGHSLASFISIPGGTGAPEEGVSPLSPPRRWYR
jgi:hypothetical protein